MTHSVAVKDSFSFVRQLSMLVCRYDACVCVGTTHRMHMCVGTTHGMHMCVGTTHGMHMPEMLHLRRSYHSCMHETAIIHMRHV